MTQPFELRLPFHALVQLFERATWEKITCYSSCAFSCRNDLSHGNMHKLSSAQLSSVQMSFCMSVDSHAF